MTASAHMVNVNGLRFRTLVEGPPDGDMVLMMHGFPEGAESWARQMHALAHAGFLAVAPDLRGYGLTDAPEGVESYGMDPQQWPATSLILLLDCVTRPGSPRAIVSRMNRKLSRACVWMPTGSRPTGVCQRCTEAMCRAYRKNSSRSKYFVG